LIYPSNKINTDIISYLHDFTLFLILFHIQGLKVIPIHYDLIQRDMKRRRTRRIGDSEGTLPALSRLLCYHR